MATGSVEIGLGPNGYGGDFALLANGDLALVQDAPGSPAATIQRLVRLILTNPRLQDRVGNQTGDPDDRSNPDYGSGMAVLAVGSNFPLAPAREATLRARIIKALLSDPHIASIPAPTVKVTAGTTPGQAIVNVSCTAITGQSIVLPSLPLPLGA